MAGDYPMVCSLYPTDFVVSVLPPEGEGAAAMVHQLWLLVWGTMCGLAVLLSGYWLVVFGRSTAGDDTGSNAQGGSMPASVVYCCLTLPGATLVVVALHTLALSRLSPWQSAISSRGLPYWMAAVVGALVVAALAVMGGTYVGRTTALAAVFGLVPVVVALGVWPTHVYGAGSAALVVMGAGLLAAAFIAWTGRLGKRPALYPHELSAMAIAGFVLLLGGLPWPALGPSAVLARAALTGLACGGLALSGIRYKTGGTGVKLIYLVGATALFANLVVLVLSARG
jgi:hypothetical protein